MILSMLSTVVAHAQTYASRLRRDDGLETVEYALIAALIAVVAIATITALGGEVNRVFNEIVTAIKGAPAAPAP